MKRATAFTFTIDGSLTRLRRDFSPAEGKYCRPAKMGNKKNAPEFRARFLMCLNQAGVMGE